MAMEMVSKDSPGKTHRERYGIVKIPTDHNISRFLELPSPGWQALHHVRGRCDYAEYRRDFPGIPGKGLVLPEAYHGMLIWSMMIMKGKT